MYCKFKLSSRRWHCLLRCAGDEALRRELLAYMANHPAVARYAAPDDVVFVPEIPHNATGELLSRRCDPTSSPDWHAALVKA
jgi:acyl-CoA synthetase (AMP-forming)/AMP-acid ligase II